MEKPLKNQDVLGEYGCLKEKLYEGTHLMQLGGSSFVEKGVTYVRRGHGRYLVKEIESGVFDIIGISYRVDRPGLKAFAITINHEYGTKINPNAY